MQLDTVTLSPPETEAHVAEIEALTEELQRAMAAMAANEVSEFEDSVVRQRAACARLHSFNARLPVRQVKTVTGATALTDGDQGQRISAATAALTLANLRYAMLLKHFRETGRIFAGMFRGYGGPPGNAFSVQRTQHSTWSCEL